MDKNEAPKIALHSIGSLFGETWKRYKAQWSVLMEIILLPTLVVILGGVLVGLQLGSFISALGILILFVGWVVFAFSILPLIYSVHHLEGVDASYKATIGWFWPFVWVGILEFLAVIGASFMLIIPGIWLGVALSLTIYVFVTEGRRGIDALRQSKDYVKGYWWSVLGRVLLLELVYLVAMLVIRIPVALVSNQIVGSLASVVIVPFFVPYAVIYSYVIFQNLRERKPGLAEMQTKEGTGFIKTSAIVGIFVPILLIILAAALAGAGLFYMMRHANFDTNLNYAPPPGYNVQVYPSQQ
ncbi:MAG TPA: hypothetical protein VIJ29_04270 [Candidatus Paceibacterota bacterium]